MKEKLIIAVLIVAGLVLAFASGWIVRGKKPAEVVEIVKVDTLTVRDTITQIKPVYITERVVDTLLFPVTDTLRLHDTTYIALARTQREYADTTYRAWVSGIEPALDSIDIFRKTQYVTVTVREPAKHWHVGVSAGYGITTKGLAPYWGVGLSYSLFSF